MPRENHIAAIARRLSISPQQAAATIELLDGGNTLPFIARYRKEVTGGLDEEQIRQLADLLDKLRAIEERRTTILKSIAEQGKLTPELQAQLEAAETLTALEDLYLPYKPRRRTRASIARDKGLQPLADLILKQELYGRLSRLAGMEQAQEADPGYRKLLERLAVPFLSDDVLTADDAWAGASDIVAETISDHPEVRRVAREKALQWGALHSEKAGDAADEKRLYELYYAFEMRVDKLRPHQVLAINRGETEKILRVHLIVPERDWRGAIETAFRSDRRSPLAALLEASAVDAAERLLLPAIERDVRRVLTEKADAHAIAVFAENLRSLLSQPPLAGYTVLGIDPGFRTGCKVAVVDPTGKLLETATIYPHEPHRQWNQALQKLALLATRLGVTLITIGNGTASRETEGLVAELIRTAGNYSSLAEQKLRYLIVNEAGASVYSASPLARSELPDLDVSLRGAVSIARRAQDPLAELVKIDPKSIGVGLYQHDVDQKALAQALDGVVESVVNAVGVDVNTASPALLSHVAGIGSKLAERMVAFRDQKGPFHNRQVLRDVPGLGPKAFEQSAGFLRIRDGDNPLDASAIHPESYPVAQAVLNKAGLAPETPPAQREEPLDALLAHQSLEGLAAELGCGAPTLGDILEQLLRPGRDPREEAPLPILRSDVLKMENLVTGMRLKGTVRNVVDFGAFVDIGVKQDGLLHRTQIPSGMALRVGDVIDVEIKSVEVERGRISLGWPG